MLIFTKHEALIICTYELLADAAHTNHWQIEALRADDIRTSGRSRLQRSWQIVHMNFFQYASGLQAVQYWPGRLVIALRTDSVISVANSISVLIRFCKYF